MRLLAFCPRAKTYGLLAFCFHGPETAVFQAFQGAEDQKAKSTGTGRLPRRTRFTITLEPMPDRLNREPIQRLRAALKRLRRDHGLRAIEVAETPADAHDSPPLAPVGDGHAEVTPVIVHAKQLDADRNTIVKVMQTMPDGSSSTSPNPHRVRRNEKKRETSKGQPANSVLRQPVPHGPSRSRTNADSGPTRTPTPRPSDE